MHKRYDRRRNIGNGRERPSELTFQVIVESTPNAIILVNKEGKIAYVNTQTVKLFGYSRAELVGQLIERLIPKRYHENHLGFHNIFSTSPVAKGMEVGRELFALHKNGTEFPVEIGLNPIVTVDGTLVLASIIDISERKQAEERFRLVVESAPNAMILVNKEGRITLVNDQTEKLFGFARKELIGSELEILIPKRFRVHHPEYRTSFFASPSVRPMGAGRDLFGVRKDGTEIQLEIGLNPLETNEGQMVLASIIDIRERKIQEATIIKQRLLEIKNKELEQFAFLASHDLQEPLRTVSNFIQVIQEDYGGQLNQQVTLNLNRIDLATKRMSVLVKALLDYSRLGREKKLVAIDCKAIVKNVLADLGNLIKTTGATIRVEELPRLNGYETELRMVFQNLLSNAIKFRKQEEPLDIRIGCVESDEGWTFSVKDNGIGISSRYFERVFDFFQRLNPIDAYKGYGIGLANCKKIVELHRGNIWVESVIGSGSTFYFTLSRLQL